MAQKALGSLSRSGAATRPRDSDGDGVHDFKEQQVGSNPNLIDSDGDTLSDGEELFVYRSSPLSLDSDGDGLSDQREVREIGSNPSDPRPGAPMVKGYSFLPAL